MNTQHTPGPWEINEFDHPSIHAEILSGDVRIVSIPQWPIARYEMQANARLIASAPDMFNALQCVVDLLGDQEGIFIEQCKAALAKAKGEK
jgi:hypothetical protein